MKKSMTYSLIFATTLLAGCASDTSECEENTFQCDGDLLMECTADGLVESMDCAAEGMMCHAEMGHCMSMDDTMDETSSDTQMEM